MRVQLKALGFVQPTLTWHLRPLFVLSATLKPLVIGFRYIHLSGRMSWLPLSKTVFKTHDVFYQHKKKQPILNQRHQQLFVCFEFHDNTRKTHLIWAADKLPACLSVTVRCVPTKSVLSAFRTQMCLMFNVHAPAAPRPSTAADWTAVRVS